MMIKKRPRSDSNAQPTDNCPLVGFEVSGGAVHGLLQRLFVKPPKVVPLISRHFQDWQRIHKGFDSLKKHEGGWHYIHAANLL